MCMQRRGTELKPYVATETDARNPGILKEISEFRPTKQLKLKMLKYASLSHEMCEM